MNLKTLALAVLISCVCANANAAPESNSTDPKSTLTELLHNTDKAISAVNIRLDEIEKGQKILISSNSGKKTAQEQRSYKQSLKFFNEQFAEAIAALAEHELSRNSITKMLNE